MQLPTKCRCNNLQKVFAILCKKGLQKTHNLVWICEIAKNTLEKLSNELENTEKGSEKEKVLSEAKEKLSDYYNDCRDVFIANYNNDKFTI